MLSLQEISDRLEIQQVLANYSYAVDGHDWDLFDTVFTEDAVLDYTEIVQKKGTRQEFRDWLAATMPATGTYQHLTATTTIVVDGDTARTSTICYNPAALERGGVIYGHWYHDTFVRGADGWRISNRYFQVCYNGSLPPIPPRDGTSP